MNNICILMDIVSKEIEIAYNKIMADDATLEFFEFWFLPLIVFLWSRKMFLINERSQKLLFLAFVKEPIQFSHLIANVFD